MSMAGVYGPDTSIYFGFFDILEYRVDGTDRSGSGSCSDGAPTVAGIPPAAGTPSLKFVRAYSEFQASDLYRFSVFCSRAVIKRSLRIGQSLDTDFSPATRAGEEERRY